MWKRYLVFIIASICSLSCSSEKESEMETPLPQLRIANAEVHEADEDKLIFFEVSLTGQVNAPVTVEYFTSDGTAMSGIDYIGSSQEILSFSPGQEINNIEITIVGDLEVETDETFQVTLLNAQNAIIVRNRADGKILNDDVEQGNIEVSIPDSGYTTPLSYENLTLIWADEFQTDKLNLEEWTHEIGDGCPNICGWGNNELQSYQEKNTAILENDFLVIEAKREDIASSKFSSSRIITKGKKEFKYGRIDIRAVLPKGQGIWPALWMLGGNIDQVGWPACGEIDIVEIIGNEPSTAHGTAHWDNGGQYASYGQSKMLSSGDFSDEFHVFSVVWNGNTIQWLLDDVQINIIDIAQENLSEFHQPFFFIFNIAVGGNWPGNPDDSTVFPQHLIVDYIRVFQ